VLKWHKPSVLIAAPPHLATLRRIACRDEAEHTGKLTRVVQKWSKFWTLAYHLDRIKGRRSVYLT
jgi:hypothetical protein